MRGLDGSSPGDDGADNFVMRMFELKPGGCTSLHVYPYEHEVFVVEREGVFVYEGNEHEFRRDTIKPQKRIAAKKNELLWLLKKAGSQTSPPYTKLNPVH